MLFCGQFGMVRIYDFWGVNTVCLRKKNSCKKKSTFHNSGLYTLYNSVFYLAVKFLV